MRVFPFVVALTVVLALTLVVVYGFRNQRGTPVSNQTGTPSATGTPTRKMLTESEKLQLLNRLNTLSKSPLTEQQKLAMLISTLHAYSPLLTLARGYAIVTQEERVITKAEEINLENYITVEISNAKLQCKVESL